MEGTTPRCPGSVHRAVLLLLGAVYLVGGLTLAGLGIADLSSATDLEDVLLVKLLSRGYVLVLTGGGCLLAITPLLCCRGDQQKSYYITMCIMLVGSLLLAAINITELATSGWHWPALYGVLLAVVGGFMQAKEVFLEHRNSKKAMDETDGKYCNCGSSTGNRSTHDRLTSGSSSADSSPGGSKVSWCVTMTVSFLTLVYEMCQLLPDDDTDLLQLSVVVAMHGAALTQLTVGLPLLMLSGLALFAGLRKQKGLAVTFACVAGMLLLVLLLTVVTAGAATDKLGAMLITSMAEYGEDTHVTNVWDLLQSGFHCCGVHSGADWTRNGSLATVVPGSCCRPFTNGTVMPCEEQPTNDDSFFETGCVTKARQLVTEKELLLGGATVVVILLLIASIVVGFFFAKTCDGKNKNKEQIPLVPQNSSTGQADEPARSRPSGPDEMIHDELDC